MIENKKQRLSIANPDEILSIETKRKKYRNFSIVNHSMV